MICKNCGKELSDDDVFCGYCGSEVYGNAREQKTDNGGSYCDKCHFPLDDQDQFCPNCGNPLRKKKIWFNKKSALIACLLVSVCCILGGVVFLVKDKTGAPSKQTIHRKQDDPSGPIATPTKALQEKEINSRSENESNRSEYDEKRRIVNCTDFTESGLALVSYEEKNGDINWCMVNTDLQTVYQLSEKFSLNGTVLDHNLDMNGNVFFIFENKYVLIYDTYTKIKELPRSEYDLLYRNRYGYCTFERNTSSGYSFEDVSYVLMDPELNVLSETTDEDAFVYPTESSDMDIYSCEYLFFDDENMYNTKTNTSYPYFDIYKNYCNIKSPGAAEMDDYDEVKRSCTYNKETGKYEIAFLFQYCRDHYEDGYYEHIICVVDEDNEVIRVNKIRRSTGDEYSIYWSSCDDDLLDHDEDHRVLGYPGHEGLYNLCFINDNDTISIYSITTGEKIFDSSDLGNIHIAGYSRYDEYTSMILDGVDDESTYLLLIDQNGKMCFDPLESNTDGYSDLYICSYDDSGIFSVQTYSGNTVYYNFEGKELHRIDYVGSAPTIFINGLGCAGDRYFDMNFDEDIFITIQNAESSADEGGKKENTFETATPETSDGDDSEQEYIDKQAQRDAKMAEQEKMKQEEEATTSAKAAPSETTVQSVEPFYGVWYAASKTWEEAQGYADVLSSYGFNAQIFLTTDWSNLNSESWYVVTAGVYPSEEEAYAVLPNVQGIYPNAYVKYSGDWQG